MPTFPWQKSFGRNSRSSNSGSIFLDGAQQHPDLPLSASGPRAGVQRSASVTERHGLHLDNRRSVALFPSHNSSSDTAALGQSQGNSTVSNRTLSTPTDVLSPLSQPTSPSITRSKTVVYRDASNRSRDFDPIYESPAAATPTTPSVWSPEDFAPRIPNEEQELYSEQQDTASMSGVAGKTSSDSGSATGLDRWSQRRLQRLNTEQGFREQRQGGTASSISPNPAADHSFMQQVLANNFETAAAQPQSLHQQSQPQQYSTYPSSRSTTNAGLSGQLSSNNNTRSTTNYAHDSSSQQQQQQQQQTSQPPDAVSQYQAHHNGRATLQSSRSYQSTTGNAATGEADSMSLSNSNGNAAASKNARAGAMNRQSVHTDMLGRENAGSSQGVPAFNAGVVPPVSRGSTFHSDSTSQQQQQQHSAHADPRRPTPQPAPTAEDMSAEEINQMIKDHKELREKYTKVKKYYFEKEDQVKNLQNSLAHQRLSQSRTSLDDSEYSTRFNRLDGLVAQLAFSIRKSWRSLPLWLAGSVNKDAIATGKQEMTAAGRAFISQWLVEEVFDKYFHPDLEPALSAQLKNVQRNIRNYATPAQTAEEEDYLTTKVVNWRLATLEGLVDALRSPQCPTFRAQMTDMLKEHLCGALATHLQEPPPSDLEGGVHMIVELVVSIAIHLPLESRDVVIEYYMPQQPIMLDHMKVESGIPALTLSIADDSAERASNRSTTSDTESTTVEPVQSKKRGMLSALTGSGNKLSRNPAGQTKSSAGASSSSLLRPESSAGKDEPPKVRMSAGIGVAIRGRSVLVKAPVFST